MAKGNAEGPSTGRKRERTEAKNWCQKEMLRERDRERERVCMCVSVNPSQSHVTPRLLTSRSTCKYGDNR